MPYTQDDCHRWRAEFPALARCQDGVPLAFLDGPAGTQVPRAVIGAVSGYYETMCANNAGAFATSRESDAMIQATREAMAAFLGAPSWREISFGANMTTLAFALSRAFARALSPGDEVVVTALDHEANRGPWWTLAERGIVVSEVALRPDGRLDEEDFARRVTPRTRLVAVGAASNLLGTVNDVLLARRLSREVGAWLLVDAVHYAPHFPVDVQAWDADFCLCSAYKFYGPHVGVLYTRPGLLEELATDRLDTQDAVAPWRIETGTLNHAALAGVGAAVDFIAERGDQVRPTAGTTLRERLVRSAVDIVAYESALAGRYAAEVAQIPGVTVWGPRFADGPRAPTVSITLDGVPAALLAERLAEQGVHVWAGDFYAARAVEVLGLTARGGVLRAGIMMYNTNEEVDRLLRGIAGIAAATEAIRTAHADAVTMAP